MDIIFTVGLILTVGALNGFAISIFLFKKAFRGNRANLVLAIIMLCFSYNMMIPGLIRYYHYDFAHFCATGFPLMFLFGPGMFYYVLFVTRKKVEFSGRDLIHLLPFLVSIIVMMPFYGQTAEAKMAAIESWSEGLPTFVLVGWAVECLHLTIYMVLSFVYVRKYSRSIRDNYSSIEKINLDWLQQLLGFKSVVWISYSAVFFFYRFGIDQQLFLYMFLFFSFSTSVLTYYIGFKGLDQPTIFGVSIPKVKRSKYLKSGMSKQMADSYHQLLLKYMDENKPYIDPNLSLGELADQTEIPINYLSQVINEKIGQNFFDFINSYRVREMKKALSQSDQNDQSILQTAFSVGFNSKSTFNAAFKKFANTTPTNFKNAMANGRS